MEETEKEWYHRVRQRLDDLSMSHAELARVVQLSQSRLGNYLNGYRQPKFDEFKRIVSALGVTADWVLFGGANRSISNPQANRYLVAQVESLSRDARRDLAGFLRVHSSNNAFKRRRAKRARP